MNRPQATTSSSASLLPSDDPYYEARQALVRRINADRAAAGLEAVEYDPLASQVSDQHCQEMAGNDYLSHWNLRGLLPYHRYHFAGGRDHLQENLSRMMVFWVRRPVRSIPYTLGSSGGYRVDTADGVPCASWVFRQES